MKPSTQSSLLGKDNRQQALSLADALFTSTQQRVLSILFGQPKRSFYVTQIMALANSGRGAVQRELSRLAKSGLVTVRNISTQKHYQANPESPLFNELCAIIRKTLGIEEPIGKALESFESKISLAFIYGSVAKGTDYSASDIDLMIVSDELTLEEVYRALAKAEQALDRTISPMLYAKSEFEQRLDRKDSFLRRVLAGPIIPLIGSIDGT